MKLLPTETELIGAWIEMDGHVTADAIEQRIGWLTKNALTKLDTGDGGWSTLYQDPNDQRLWELTYPKGHMHGGGPRSLFIISLEEVAKKYGLGRFA